MEVRYFSPRIIATSSKVLKKPTRSSIDFHKLFWQPIPCSAFLLRDARYFDSIKLHADYLNPELHEDDGIPNLVTTSLLTTRRFDALKLWISFQSLGRAKLAAMIDRTIELANHTAMACSRHRDSNYSANRS